jgi:hypothetical protein
LKGDEAGVLFNPKFIMLIKLVANAAGFRGLLLRPIPTLPELPKAISESGRYLVHLGQFETFASI